jgi:arylsulfatase A-like enzyme
MKCFGEERGRIEALHLGRLAAEGMRFTDAHVPTRVGPC